MLRIRHGGMRSVRQRTDQKSPNTYRSNKVKAMPFQAFSSQQHRRCNRHVNSPTEGSIMKKFQLCAASLIVAAATLTAVGGAQAQSQSTGGMSSMYSQGISYIDLGVGKSDYSLGNGTGIFDSNEGDTSYSLRGGRYFSPNWGMELGYTDFGSVNRAGGRTKTDGINLSLVGKMPLSPVFNLLGKVGTTYSRTEVSSAIGSGVTPGSENGFGLSYGLGVEYAFTPQFSTVLQYESTDMKFAGDRNDRIGNTSLSIRYTY
jgi:opacity protein-like surface antigen